MNPGSGAYPASYAVVGVNRQGHEDEHSPPAIAEVMNVWRYTSTRTYAFVIYVLLSRSQWPRDLRHELSRSSVRIPLEGRVSVCAFILCLCCPVRR
jgi:hypothetical protein